MDYTSIGCSKGTRDRLKAYRDRVDADNYDEALAEALDELGVEEAGDL